jgi:hypothetical protein
MEPEPDLAQPSSDPLPQVPGLLFADPMHHNVIAIAFEVNARELPSHPRVEGIMEKEIGKQR